MKKMVLVIAVISMLFFTGLSSAISINFNDNPQYNHTKEKSTCVLEIELPKYAKDNPTSMGWYDYIRMHGIKLWARGWGTFNCKVIDEDYAYYELIEGRLDEETWRANIWAPENLKLYSETNTFKYSYYDDNAETRTNLLISSFPFIILLLDKLKPGSAENFRRNQKSPFKGTGPHELSIGLIFKGTVTKGQTYEGEPMSSKMVDTDDDGVPDTDYPYYEIVARCSILSLVERNVDLTPWEFFQISLYRRFYWKDPNYVPYDC